MFLGVKKRNLAATPSLYTVTVTLRRFVEAIFRGCVAVFTGG
jgi:hypothetical protein